MQLRSLKQSFQRLPIKRQIVFQSVGLVVFACLVLSLFAATMIRRILEAELLATANEEAGNRLDLIESHLGSLEEEILRIARSTSQLRHSNADNSFRNLRSALITELMLHRESRNLGFTDGTGILTHAVGSSFTMPGNGILQQVLASGETHRAFYSSSNEYLIVAPIKDQARVVGAVMMRFDLKIILQNYFTKKSHLIYTFEHKGREFFQTGHDDEAQDSARWILRQENGILQTLGISCRYQALASDFDRPLNEGLAFLVIVSIALITIAIGLAVALSQNISRPAQELYHHIIRQEDSFVPNPGSNELLILHEALEYREEKLSALIEGLEKGKDEAVKASQTKSEFLANMSHEIRAPMNGVLGMAQLIRFTDMTAEQRKYVDAIIDAGDTLMGIINDILDFSKIEAGAFQIDFQDFDLKRCLQSTIQIFEVKAKEKGLELLLDVKEDMPRMIRGDDLRLRQILNNLISNAIKFTAKGQISVHVNLENQESHKIALHISVHDTGIGIHKDDLQKLFKSFSQVDSSIARKFGGTGLGLAISQALCEMMGGSIGVESTPGKGSTFYFTLLFEPAQEQAPALAETTAGFSKNLRILVADDSEVNQMIIRTMFKKLGIRAVDIASDGQEVIEMAAHAKYDLIYMDVHMPMKEGPDAARIILAENPSDPPLIIALTADMFKDDHAKCFEAGMVDLVMKPLQLVDLRDSLNKHGTHARADREPINQAS